jgi:hypothetical protein
LIRRKNLAFLLLLFVSSLSPNMSRPVNKWCYTVKQQTRTTTERAAATTKSPSQQHIS